MGVDNLPNTYPMRTMSVGDTLGDESRVTVLACWLLAPSDVDAYAVWVVLCYLPHNRLHPFAVWNAYDRPNGWTFGNGDYCATLGEAVRTYEARGGRESL